MSQPDARRESTGAASQDEPPPFLGRWRNVFAAVALNLATLIALFTLFTRSFNR